MMAISTGGVGGRIVVASDELRLLAGVTDGVVPPVDGAMARVGSIMGGLDRRGWNAGPVDGLWSAVRSEWVCMKGSLTLLRKDLERRATLADQLNAWLALGGVGTFGLPTWLNPYGPGYGPGQVPGLVLPADLGGVPPWFDPQAQEALRRQGLAALDQIPLGALGYDPPPPPPPPEPEPEDDDKGFWEKALDGFQTGLDVVGLVPVLGEPADALNAGIYTARGDYVNAGLSAAALLPIGGQGATAVKLGRKVVQHADEAAAVGRQVAKHGDEVVDGSRLIRRADGTVVEAVPDPRTGRLRDPETGQFISDPANPPSPYTFTDAQRRAEWKRLAEDPNSPLTPAQREEIRQRGWRGPQRINPETGELETMELSHEPVPLREGGTEVTPRWPDEHAAVDPHRQLKK